MMCTKSSGVEPSSWLSSLQAQVVQQSGENAKLKLRERELNGEVGSLRTHLTAVQRGQTPPASPYQHTANNSSSSPVMREPTEMEVRRYLDTLIL